MIHFFWWVGGLKLKDFYFACLLGFSLLCSYYLRLNQNHKINALVISTVLFYAAGVWGFQRSPDSNAPQSGAMSWFRGVHKYGG